MLDSATLHISVREVTNRALSAIQHARNLALANRAQLTPREREVFVSLVAGRTLDDIAATTNLTLRTVKFHLGNILQKLGADSRADLIRLTTF